MTLKPVSLDYILLNQGFLHDWSCLSVLLVIRTATTVNEMLGNVNTGSAIAAFEKMEEKGD